MALADRKNELGLPMVVASTHYENGQRVADVPLEQAGQYARGHGSFVWIGLHEPDEDVLACLRQQFDLHPLAVEDAHRAHQRPKAEVYNDMLFVVLRTVQMVNGLIVYGETHVFCGQGYVVAVRHGPSSSYRDVRTRCEQEPKLLAHGEDYVLYSIMDFVADNFFPVLDDVRAEVESIEELIASQRFGKPQIERLYQLRRQLLTLRLSVGPMLELCSRLERLELPMIDPEIRPYYRDVHDHVRIVAEAMDNLRESLAAAFDAALMLQAAQQNEITRKLAAWAAMLAVPTAVAGIYGMNFDNMPELAWKWGYFAVLGGIAAIVAVLYLRLRRAGWL